MVVLTPLKSPLVLALGGGLLSALCLDTQCFPGILVLQEADRHTQERNRGWGGGTWGAALSMEGEEPRSGASGAQARPCYFSVPHCALAAGLVPSSQWTCSVLIWWSCGFPGGQRLQSACPRKSASSYHCFWKSCDHWQVRRDAYSLERGNPVPVPGLRHEQVLAPFSPGICSHLH